MEDKKMGGLSENGLIEQLSDVGNRLFQPPNSTHLLLNLLDELEFLLTKVGQAPSYLLQAALLIPMKALISDELFKHSDPNVRITIASCLNEVMRITAPIPPYADDKMREIFKLIVSSFEHLSSQPGRCYSKAVLILQNVARLSSCVMMLDIDCDPLVTKMFELFHKKISPKLPHDVHLAMANIMSVIIQESDSVSDELLKVLLASIKMENQPPSLIWPPTVVGSWESVSPESWKLGIKVFEECAVKLRPYIMETVSSMGCCLQNYARILSSICNPEPDTAINFITDASILVNNDPSENLALPAENIQALTTIESVEHVNSKRRRKQNSHVIDKETTHPQFVQALEAVQSFEFFKASGTGKTVSKRIRKHDSTNLDGEAIEMPFDQVLEAIETEPSDCVQATGPQFVQTLEVIETYETEPGDYVQVFEAAEKFEHLDNDISKNNGILKKDSSAAGDGIKRKRGRPRKIGIGVLENNSIQQKNDVLTAQVDNEQASEATESIEHVNAAEMEGTSYKSGMESEFNNLDVEVTALEREQARQGTADDDISKNNAIVKNDSSVVSDGIKRKRGRPRKKGIIGVVEVNALQNKSDVFEVQESYGDKLLKQEGFSGGSGDEVSQVVETPHGIKNYDGDLVGCRIKVWWPLDRRYYKGKINFFDAYGGKHMIKYDDGEEEMLYLMKERWEFIGDETSIDKVILGPSEITSITNVDH